MKKNNNHLKTNLLICGDNLKALDDLIKQGIKVDLIYLDPPFFSNRHYEVVWGDEAEVRSFKDRWAGGRNVYIEWMRERVIKMHEVLKDTGSFYLHCDLHASHYLKVMLDEVFGHRNFRNEIVWCYTGPSRNVRDFPDKHDIIFRYINGNKWTFNLEEAKIPYSESFLARREHSEGKSGIYGGRGEKGKSLEQYKKGKLIEDWWTDIPAGGQISRRELLGYPTQKPESLLERIIKVSSNKDDLVLDPFCGCGTAMAVAQRLKRKWIGIDISPTAINLIDKRLEKVGAIRNKDFDVIGMPTTETHLRELEPFEFQNWIINEMQARHSKRKTLDMGIDGFYEKTIFTDRAGIQVKQSEKVGRNVVDNFETALKRQKYEKGYIVAFSFTKGANEEVARVKQKDLIIKLVKVEDLLYGKFKV